ncbi:MAG: c-type cytochrome [Nitrosomonadales bacterium]|nr:c-type cytochrome [Nitrosomonadales bacterium]
MGQAGLIGFMNVGIVLLIIGFSVLLSMVQFELGPLSNLPPARKWLMTLILGSGMVAFSIKLIIIATLINFPKQTIQRNVAAQKAPLVTDWEQLNKDTPRIRLEGMQKAYVWRTLPDRAPAPEWNPTTPEKVALGERLFHDPALSIDRTLSCSSCHDVRKGAGEDHRSDSLGVKGQLGSRNAPTVWNSGFQAVLFWDGRAASLEEQAKGPPVNPVEMGMPSLEAVEQRIRDNPAYRESFAKAFGADQPITIRQISAAIAAYERTLNTTDTPYDRFVRGDEKALSAAQLRGMALFQSVGCVSCHSGPNFSGASVFDPPPAAQRLFPVFDSPKYVNRYNLTKDAGANAPGSKQAIWRIPSLRNVALTAPYLHNGSVDNLPEVVRIMATVQRGKRVSNDANDNQTIIWSSRDRTLARIESAPLSDRDVDDIVVFLQALSSDRLLARSKSGA